MTIAHRLPSLEALPAELLDGSAWLTLEDLARACRMGPDWVVARLEAGLLEARSDKGPHNGEWHFASATLVRARRLAQLETTFDADPHLAALTADLIEEVADLRQRLRQMQALLDGTKPAA